MSSSPTAGAPPARVRVRDASGFRPPFVYRQVLVDRLFREHGEDTSTPVAPLVRRGRVISTPPEAGPLLLLGADALGRDIFARLVHGARRSLGVVMLGALGALVLGTLIGGAAGGLGGRIESALMRVADFVIVLPARI